MTIGPRVTQPPAGMPGEVQRTRSDGVAGAEGAKPFGGPAVVVGAASAGMPMPGGAVVDAAVERDIRRDDELGSCCRAAFDLKPPSFQDFTTFLETKSSSQSI